VLKVERIRWRERGGFGGRVLGWGLGMRLCGFIVRLSEGV
jgi:hypothetical protein